MFLPLSKQTGNSNIMPKHKHICILALVVWILASASIPGALAAQTTGPTLKVEAHYSGHFKFGEWLPLRVTLANDGPPIRAEVRADTTEAGGQTTFTAPVELPTGARKRLTLYVMPPSFAQAVRVRLMEGERELAKQSVQVTVERNVDYMIGIIAPRAEPFAVLGGLSLQATSSGVEMWAARMGPLNPRPVAVIPVSLDDIPDRPEGLRALDALVISGVDTSALSPEQAQALQGWITQGGRLILGGGAGAARTLAGVILPDGLRLTDAPGDLPSLEALGTFGEQDVRVPGPFAVTWPVQPPSQPEYNVLIEQQGRALLTEKRVGDGYVNYAALDLSGSPFDAWAGALRFWEKLLTPGSAYPLNAPTDVSPRLMRANSLSYALQNLPALELPSIRWLGGLLILYVVLVGPLNYLALRRLRKLEWGWITILALTALFSVGAFALGFNMRGGDVIINKVSILAFSGRGAASPVQTYIGIFSPARRAYTINLPGQTLATPLSIEGNPWGGGGVGSPGALEIVQGEPTQVRGVQVNQWAMQSFAAESSVPEEWGIESDLLFDGDRLRGTLVNHTDQVLLDAVVVNGNQFARLGDLAPGTSKTVDQVLQNTWNSNFPYFLYEHIWQNAGPNGPPRELQVRQQILENYYQNPNGPSQPPPVTTLIGWMQISPLEIGVTDVRWMTQQTSLVIAALNVQYPTGPIHLFPGSLTARMVEMQGDTGMCGAQNQIYLNWGTATLEYTLPEALNRMEVTRLALVITSDNVGSVLPTIELYTRSGEWIKLDAPQSGSNELTDPARFVQAGGIVSIRLTNNENNWTGCSQYSLEVEGTVD